MADLKISALPASTTPLAGTEVLPVVQSSTTKQVSVANLTAGRAVATAALSATGIVSTTDATDASSTTAASLKTAGGLAVVKKTYIGDNIVQGTAAKGVNFTANTPATGMTNQLLNWYEEGVGTYTMTASTSGTITLNPSFQTLRYTRVGRLVTVAGHLNVSSVSAPVGILRFNGLPFTTIAGALNITSFSVTSTGLAAAAITMITGITDSSSTSATIYKYSAGTVANLAGDVQAGSSFYISLTYAI